MKAPEDRALGSGPAHWPVDTAQVHFPHTKFNKSNIDDWSECLYFRVQRSSSVGVIFQDLGVQHSEVDHKNFGGQVSRSQYSQEDCKLRTIYVSKVERYRIPRLTRPRFHSHVRMLKSIRPPKIDQMGFWL